ncbi:MAG: HAD-IA family hydrolase [Pseudomonadota bacterium]
MTAAGRGPGHGVRIGATVPQGGDLRLVVLDFDGTLVDSQALIQASMARAFAKAGLQAPSRAAVLGIVGLSLPEAIAVLQPGLDPVKADRVVEGYRIANHALGQGTDGRGMAPLFAGARAALDRLAALGPELLLGIATGKSRSGLDDMLAQHDLEGYFTTIQTADRHPSKPHPAMLEACLAATGVAPERAVMVGDTSFDIEMGRAAGLRTIGVSWGYHTPDRLAAAGADRVIASFEALDEALAGML